VPLLPAGYARSVATNVTLHPNGQDLPGTAVLAHLADGIDAWALIAAAVGVVVGGVVWAFGHYSQNYQQSYNGRKGVMISGVAALLIGAAPRLIDFFVGQGQTVAR